MSTKWIEDLTPEISIEERTAQLKAELNILDGIPITQLNKAIGTRVRRGLHFDGYPTSNMMPPINADIIMGTQIGGTIIDLKNFNSKYAEWVQVQWDGGKAWWYRAGLEHDLPGAGLRFDLYMVV